MIRRIWSRIEVPFWLTAFGALVLYVEWRWLG